MDTISKNPKNWLNFDFPFGCVLDEGWREFFKGSAARSPEGGCCPFVRCRSLGSGATCDPGTVEKCSRACKEFYEKYIKGGEE